MDVGANIGVIGIGFLVNGWAANAVLIEPDPDNFKLLEQNTEQNNLGQSAICLNCAMSDIAGNATLEISDQNLGDHRIRTSLNPKAGYFGEETRNVIEVTTQSLDMIAAALQSPLCDSIGLVWVDVQGFEGHGIRGGANLWALSIPLCVEVCPYMVLRTGCSRENFQQLLSSNFTNYLVWRRAKYVSYPIRMFGMYWDELGESGDFENVIFLKTEPESKSREKSH